MAGQLKRMLDQIILQKSKGDPTLMTTTKTKLILKGFNPDKFTLATEDNPDQIRRVREIAREMGVNL